MWVKEKKLLVFRGKSSTDSLSKMKNGCWRHAHENSCRHYWKKIRKPQASCFLRLTAPRDKNSLSATTQLVHGSIDAKSELVVKGRRQLTRTQHTVVSRPDWKFYITATLRHWRQDLWILKIINYPRNKNLSFSCEAIPAFSVTTESSNCSIASFQIAVIHSNCSN